MSLRSLAELTFWLGAAALVYTYVGYPVLLVVVSRLRPRLVRKAEQTPRVSVIITAYNEERDLAAKLENTLALDYDSEKLQVIVPTHCSTDRAAELARPFAPRCVCRHSQTERLGATAA